MIGQVPAQTRGAACEWCGHAVPIATAIPYQVAQPTIIGQLLDPRKDVLRAPLICDGCIGFGRRLRELVDEQALADLGLLLASIRAQRARIAVTVDPGVPPSTSVPQRTEV